MSDLVPSDIQDGAVIVLPPDRYRLFSVEIPYFDGAHADVLLDRTKLMASREDVGVVQLFFSPPPVGWNDDKMS
jgi:hypothetical protein